MKLLAVALLLVAGCSQPATKQTATESGTNNVLNQAGGNIVTGAAPKAQDIPIAIQSNSGNVQIGGAHNSINHAANTIPYVELNVPESKPDPEFVKQAWIDGYVHGVMAQAGYSQKFNPLIATTNIDEKLQYYQVMRDAGWQQFQGAFNLK